MPLYEYECLECGLRFDKLQRFALGEPVVCPNGHSHVHRLLSQPAIVFRGSGFYVTDNRRSSPQRPAKGSRQDEAKAPTETAKTEEQTSV